VVLAIPHGLNGDRPINAIYQARFNKYLNNRGFADTSGQKVWAFLGDGEMDEVDALVLLLAAREELDNLIFVVNCNLHALTDRFAVTAKLSKNLNHSFVVRAGMYSKLFGVASGMNSLQPIVTGHW